MAKSNGIKDLKQAAKLLNKHAPDGEKLAYINKKEAELLRAHGGSGIQTLAGVPSYIDWGAVWDTATDWGGKALEFVGWKDKDGPVNLSEIGKDIGSVWAGLEAKKSQEGLNAHEQKIYNDLKAQMATAEKEFAINVAGGPAVTNVPTKIEDVASYTDVTLPALKTTAVAEGGRIGYNLGGITEEQNSMVTDMLNKGMDISTISTITNITEDQIKMIINQINEAQSGLEQSGALENLNLKAHGGRIGYDKGTHPLDQVAMDTFGMPFEELNILQQIVVSQSKAYGGRIGAKEGGIMPLLNLGGMEKDYRQDGGFVPIGRREKADDVPARLSKNEFVFTADAVRAAGGGDIDQGAQRMYNVMKNLEAGGEISEQSQGKA